MFYPRFVEQVLVGALEHAPSVTLTGPRQAGKSTLVQRLVESPNYLTLDDAVMFNAASTDPVGFVSGVSALTAIDEVQRAPELLVAVKASIDRDRRPGRFILTGSANVLAVPAVSQSLAGRTRFSTLFPLAQAEIEGVRSTFLERLKHGRAARELPSLGSRRRLCQLLVRGGYPEMVKQPVERERRAWMGSYVTALLQRDLRDLAAVRHLDELPRLLTLVADQSATTLNVTRISTDLGISRKSIDRYLTLLEQIFLLWRVPAWHASIRKQQVKSAKTLLVDGGLLGYLLNVNPSTLEQDGVRLGRALENFIGMELLKLASWSDSDFRLYHWRTSAGDEVDFVLERDGTIVGIEVKAAQTVDRADLRHLEALRRAEPRRWLRGIVLYAGSRAVSFGEDLHAWPITSLWAA